MTHNIEKKHLQFMTYVIRTRILTVHKPYDTVFKIYDTLIKARFL